MRIYIIISLDAADRLIVMAEREKRAVNAQASWLLERVLEGAITIREREGHTGDCCAEVVAHGSGREER